MLLYSICLSEWVWLNINHMTIFQSYLPKSEFLRQMVAKHAVLPDLSSSGYVIGNQSDPRSFSTQSSWLDLLDPPRILLKTPCGWGCQHDPRHEYLTFLQYSGYWLWLAGGRQDAFATMITIPPSRSGVELCKGSRDRLGGCQRWQTPDAS